ncbi:PepSY-associated TM helix domain-containing protein [Fulvivirgaceae bacterium BMA12]|uniref:PepSY-associated TM helix domain-containing protein n=1 Tax=Agaribacillus aureus TaxID=3051825 RepID=A0ABT8LIF8_9BACT|nr:PepSY-associated TM helix domain-containing protein [Fulvivirgaceae bacterium BMA12]
MTKAKKQGITLKKAIGKIHLWLGLGSGLVVFILGVTGCILVFEEEIRLLNGTSRIYKTVEDKGLSTLPPSQIMKKAKEAVPSERSMVYSIFKKQENAAVITWHYTPDPDNPNVRGQYLAITQDPYTGEILTIEDWNHDFWGTMFYLHTNLLLPPGIGSPITSYATLIFVVLMITGLVLWYPKSKKGFRQRFTVKWTASPKRLNYDLHNVFGFYMTWMAIFIAITGMIFGLSWFRNAVYYTTSGGETLDFYNGPQSKPPIDSSTIAISRQDNLVDSLVAATLAREKDLTEYSVNYPEREDDIINVSVFTKQGKTYFRHNEFAYDRYSGELLSSEYWQDHNAGERILHLNYAIHLGLIGGLPTKILAFLVSFIAASLPITGFYIWWGRKRKVKGESATSRKALTSANYKNDPKEVVKPIFSMKQDPNNP